MDHPELQSLSYKIDQLLEINQQLRAENQQLRAAQSGWESDRTKLIQQNELARSKIAEMISRLKAIEEHG